ncbi:hypothetical protein [Mariniblastus fucicola]|uniref:Type IV pilin biogenesis protein n=1 Tax=Mariniblastus fucicola TaxID=980251 RepID=A0A5B9P1Y2_9BACT|nr:hypothetical protein [Mariniblastus fucicola]QEG20517.1 hypothetical protein MFFC18_03660 [Mariniblastus fucicola]
MGDQLTVLTDDVTRERLVSDQSARELAPLLTPNQRALVSLFATAELYGLELKTLVSGYAKETGLAAAVVFADKLPAAGMKTELHPLDIAADIEDLLPVPGRVALNSARASGTLRSFYRSWLAQSVDDRLHWVRHENTNAATIGRLAVRTFLCVWFLTVILLFVIPEHQKMYEEFGMELNRTAKLFLSVSVLFSKLFPLFLLVLFLIFLYIVCLRRSVLRGYLRRWMPGRWRQIVLPQNVLKRKLMAWDLLAFRGDAAKAKDGFTDWDDMVASKQLGRREARIMKGSSQLETQAWLLRNMADNKLELRKTRSALAIGTFSFLFQALLAFIIILATFTIFSMLIEVMKGLSG